MQSFKLPVVLTALSLICVTLKFNSSTSLAHRLEALYGHVIKMEDSDKNEKDKRANFSQT